MHKITSRSNLREVLKFLGLPANTPFLYRDTILVLTKDITDASIEVSKKDNVGEFYRKLFWRYGTPEDNYDFGFHLRTMVVIQTSCEGLYRIDVHKRARDRFSGLIHNDNGPAVILFEHIDTYTGFPSGIYFYNDSRRHRIGGPALLHFGRSGKLFKEVHYRFDLLHNPVGPAYRFLNGSGVWKNSFYHNGVCISCSRFYEDYEKRLLS